MEKHFSLHFIFDTFNIFGSSGCWKTKICGSRVWKRSTHSEQTETGPKGQRSVGAITDGVGALRGRGESGHVTKSSQSRAVNAFSGQPCAPKNSRGTTTPPPPLFSFGNRSHVWHLNGVNNFMKSNHRSFWHPVSFRWPMWQFCGLQNSTNLCLFSLVRDRRGCHMWKNSFESTVVG